jgi:acetyl-CoA carboxylase biotin carboxyl carrier protein
MRESCCSAVYDRESDAIRHEGFLVCRPFAENIGGRRPPPQGSSLLDLLREPALPRRLNLSRAVELKDIKAIIDLMRKNDLSVFEMEKDGFRLKLQKGATEKTVSMVPLVSAPAAAPTTASQVVSPSAGETKAAAPPPEKTALRDIVSPMVGTFYRAASPDAPAFVDVGKEVTPETVVCIIEAMKVMNEIKAETSGLIAEVVAENGKPVQFGQVLYRVR